MMSYKKTYYILLALPWDDVENCTYRFSRFKLLYGPQATPWEFSLKFAWGTGITYCRDAFTSILSTRVPRAVRNALQITLNYMM